MTLAHPKPRKPVKDRAHLARVAALACMCCGARPVHVHHCIHGRGGGRRSDDETIPLCHSHHVMLHLQPYAWRERYGLDVDMLPRVEKLLEQEKS